MADCNETPRRKRRSPRPLDEAGLRDLGLHYAGRYATTAARLKQYLARKVRERGWAGEDEPPIDAIAQRFVELGYIDDAAFAEARSRDLLRRGYGARRVSQALFHAGVDREETPIPALSQSETRAAALSFARRRRLGPFGTRDEDPRTREKQLAALVRAGHDFDAARALVDAANEKEAEEWASSAED